MRTNMLIITLMVLLTFVFFGCAALKTLQRDRFGRYARYAVRHDEELQDDIGKIAVARVKAQQIEDAGEAALDGRDWSLIGGGGTGGAVALAAILKALEAYKKRNGGAV